MPCHNYSNDRISLKSVRAWLWYRCRVSNWPQGTPPEPPSPKSCVTRHNQPTPTSSNICVGMMLVKEGRRSKTKRQKSLVYNCQVIISISNVNQDDFHLRGGNCTHSHTLVKAGTQTLNPGRGRGVWNGTLCETRSNGKLECTMVKTSEYLVKIKKKIIGTNSTKKKILTNFFKLVPLSPNST